MNEHLSQPECKFLADAGLPQELGFGDLYWSIDHTGEWVTRLTTSRSEHFTLNKGYFKTPSLDALMEFAKTLSGNWSLHPHGGCWVVELFNEKMVLLDAVVVEKEPLILAVYKLIEKLMEVEA